MTILNMWLSESQVQIASDSEGLSANGERAGMSKVLLLPHANLVIGSRGDRMFLHAVFSAYLLASKNVPNFDVAASHLQEVVEGVSRHASEQGAQPSPFHLILAGWSEKLGRMAAHVCVGSTGDSLAVIRELPREGRALACEMAPWDESRPLPELLCVEDVLSLGRMQARWLRERGAAGGGELILTTLSRAEASFRRLGSLECGASSAL